MEINLEELSPQLKELLEKELLSKKDNNQEKIEYLMDKYSFDERYAVSFINDWEYQDKTKERDLKSIKENVIFYNTDDGETDFNEFNLVDDLKLKIRDDYEYPDDSGWHIYKIFINGEEKDYEIFVDVKFLVKHKE